MQNRQLARKGFRELLPQLHSSHDIPVTHCSQRYQQTIRERLGPYLVKNRATRLPEVPDARQNIDRRRVRRTRRGTASRCCRLTKRVEERRPVAACGGRSASLQQERDGLLEGGIDFPQ